MQTPLMSSTIAKPYGKTGPAGLRLTWPTYWPKSREHKAETSAQASCLQCLHQACLKVGNPCINAFLHLKSIPPSATFTLAQSLLYEPQGLCTDAPSCHVCGPCIGLPPLFLASPNAAVALPACWHGMGTDRGVSAGVSGGERSLTNSSPASTNSRSSGWAVEHAALHAGMASMGAACVLSQMEPLLRTQQHLAGAAQAPICMPAASYPVEGASAQSVKRSSACLLCRPLPCAVQTCRGTSSDMVSDILPAHGGGLLHDPWQAMPWLNTLPRSLLRSSAHTRPWACSLLGRAHSAQAGESNSKAEGFATHRHTWGPSRIATPRRLTPCCSWGASGASWAWGPSPPRTAPAAAPGPPGRGP